MGAQLGDFNVTGTTPTVLTIGSNCSTATPCNVRWGSRVSTFTTSETVTLTAGTGTAFFYVDSAGMLTAGHNLTLSCASPCSAVAGVTAFPVNAIPLFTWTATSGTWDPAGGLAHWLRSCSEPRPIANLDYRRGYNSLVLGVGELQVHASPDEILF